MLWVVVFLAIAVIGVVMVVCYVVWLAHKTSDLLAEVTVLTERGASLAELLGQISLPARQLDATGSPLEDAGRNDPPAPFSRAGAT